MYIPKYFKVHELVPPQVYADRGEDAWELLDDRILITADRLRERYGSITINNYHWGGLRQWSGLRTPDSPDYRPYSQHTFGRAIDCVFKGVTPEEVRQDIIGYNNGWGQKEGATFQFITSIELGTDTWLHCDVRNCEPLKTY